MSVHAEVVPQRPEFLKLLAVGLVLLFSAEIGAVLFYTWQLSILHEWQRSDPSMVRTSPDAAYLYRSALENVYTTRGFLFGLLGTAVVTAALSIWGPVRGTRFVTRIFVVLAVAVPFVALAALRP